MNNAISMYALGLNQAAKAILANGVKRTVLLQGPMGSGKSSVLKMLGSTLTKHTQCYFDCTTKDLGDITIPSLQTMDEQGYVRFVPNEELGIHLNKPIILMVDEYGKANPAVKNAMLRLMLERKVGSYALHPESIVFATTNLGAEGIGDLLLPHHRNRVTVVTTRRATWQEWVEWGINNDVDPIVLGWAKNNAALFASFEDVKNPDENEFIFHPQAKGRTAFTTERSLEAASDWVKVRDQMDDQTLTSVLMGTIGNRGAMELMTFIRLADQVPTVDSIRKDPMGAKVPTSAGALAMVVYRALSSMERDWTDQWVDYMGRLDPEAQGLFVNNVRDEKYSRRDIVLKNKKFTEWAMKNNHMFAADKR